jgi:uncharacterized protein
MQANILWTGREYYSLENCLVSVIDGVIHVDSTIVGKYGDALYKVNYRIATNAQGQTISCEVVARRSDEIVEMDFKSNGMGEWTLNGKSAPEFYGCIDVDIPLTPFTNTLPVRRLQLKPGEESVVSVLYIDILEKRISAVRQLYRRVSYDTYHYENIPNDFEANIKVDDDGLVIDYPQLFVRTARVASNFDDF